MKHMKSSSAKFGIQVIFQHQLGFFSINGDFSASNIGIQSLHFGSRHLAGDGLEVKGVEHRVERPRSAARVSTGSLQELTTSPNINMWSVWSRTACVLRISPLSQ